MDRLTCHGPPLDRDRPGQRPPWTETPLAQTNIRESNNLTDASRFHIIAFRFNRKLDPEVVLRHFRLERKRTPEVI